MTTLAFVGGDTLWDSETLYGTTSRQLGEGFADLPALLGTIDAGSDER